MRKKLNGIGFQSSRLQAERIKLNLPRPNVRFQVKDALFLTKAQVRNDLEYNSDVGCGKKELHVAAHQVWWKRWNGIVCG